MKTRHQNTLYLVKDPGNPADYFAMPLGGGVSQVENSQCIVYNVGTAAIGSGTQLTLTVKLQFKPLKPPNGPHFWGNHAVFVAAMDQKGGNTGFQAMGVHQVARPKTVPPPAPQVLAVEPALSTAAALTIHELRMVVHAPTSGSVSNAQVLINTAVDGAYACYFTWSRQYNSLFLFSDPGTSYTQVPLGGGASAQNSQCTIYASGSSAVDNGTYLTLTFRVAAKATFAGRRLSYVAAQTATGNTGWQPVGGWHIKASPDLTAPELTSPVVSVTSTGATFLWSTSELADAQAFITGGPSTPWNPTLKTTQTAKLTSGLAAATTYSYTAYSRDQFGNIGVASGQFRTADAVPVVGSTNGVGCSNTPTDECKTPFGIRWEATGAAGVAADGTPLWAHGWWDQITSKSYVAVWKGKNILEESTCGTLSLTGLSGFVLG